jgi:hypothetical protein
VPTLWNMAIVLGTIAFFIVLSIVYKDKSEKKGEEKEDRQMVH